MESTSSDEGGSLRDNNVDLNDENMELQVGLEVNSQLASMDGQFASNQQNSENPEPFVGMEFESEEAAKLFYMSYASRVGFSVRISKSRRSRNDESIIMRRFVCSKEGFHMKKGGFDDGKKKRKRATIREGCNAMIEVIQKYYGRWVVTKLVKEHNHVVAAPSRVRYIAPEEYAQLEPFLGMEFPSHEDAQTFYYAYASRVGFDVRIRLSRRSTRDESFVMRRFVCTKEGFTPSEENCDDNKKKRNRTPSREGCKAMFEVIKKDYDKWIVSKLVLEHTHGLAVAPSKVHYIQSQSEVVVLAKSGTLHREKSTTQSFSKPPIGDSMGSYNAASYDLDFQIEIREPRHNAFGLDDTQKLLGYFKRMNAENPTFSYAFQFDKNNCLTHAFWADARARASYYYFGDAVTLDTSFKEDKDLLPFVMFMGLNHHLQSVMFGCALLVDESEASFVWLFENWIAAMGAHHPASLMTDYNEAMGAAASKVFPDTRHQFCGLHILSRSKEKLANIFLMCPTFDEDFQRCVNDSETVERFECCWKSILDSYDLSENSWLVILYAIRRKWVPVFLKDTFTAEISETSRPESLKEFFKKYFNTKTPLPVFITLFEHAMAGWSEKEALEDLASSFTRPVLKAPSNMLKQAAEIYTRAVFSIFQDEFVESLGYYVDKLEDGLISKYNVTKEEDARITCTVTYNFSDKRAKCSCCKFETTGILCRHILRVFLTVGVRSLPEFYILKRWTKEAKNGFVLDECLRYNELYRDAVRYAKEGSTSGEVFSFAQQTLQVAFAEVIQMKQDFVNRCAMR